MLRNFTFEFDDGATVTSVDPVFDEDANLTPTISRDDDFGFYQRELSTGLIFRGADYDYLKAIEDTADCISLDLIVRHSGNIFFSKTVKFQTPHFKFDADNCQVEVGGDSADDYACFLAAWENEINILTGTAKVTVNTIQGSFETITCDDTPGGAIDPEDYGIPITDCITPGEGWTLIDQLVNTSSGNDSVFSTYIRQTYTAACSSGVPVPPCGDGWILLDDNCPVDATYVRAVPVTALVVATELSSGELYRATAGVRGGASFDGSNYNNIQISNGVLLSEILDTYLPCDLTVVSDFFSINGDDTHPVNDVYTEAKAKLEHLIIFQKSDVKRANALNDATNGKWSLDSLFSALKAQFDIQIRITGTMLRIEHRTYFVAGMGEDLTATQPARLVGTNKWTYDQSQQISEEKWKFMEVVSAVFEGPPYQYTCFSMADRRKEEYPINDTNNDVGALIGTPDVYADAGFVFVNACKVGSTYYLVSELSLLNGEILLNGHLSIPNLMRTYHTYDRPRLSGTWNAAPVTFDSARRIKIQNDVTFKLCPEDFATWDETELITTDLGAGQVESAEYDAAAGEITVSLRY